MTDTIPGYPPLPEVMHEIIPSSSEPFPVFTVRQMLAFADATADMRGSTAPQSATTPQGEPVRVSPTYSPPERAGVYAWSAGALAALVLVNTRPSSCAEGVQLNGHVLASANFYDGCPVAQWGRDGRWTLLHDFDAAKAEGAQS